MLRVAKTLSSMLLLFVLVVIVKVTSMGSVCDKIRDSHLPNSRIPYKIIKKDQDYELRDYDTGGHWLKMYSPNIPYLQTNASWDELANSSLIEVIDDNGVIVKLNTPVFTKFSNSEGYPLLEVYIKLFEEQFPMIANKNIRKQINPEQKVRVFVKCFQNTSEQNIRQNLNELFDYAGVDKSLNPYYADYYVDTENTPPLAEVWILA